MSEKKAISWLELYSKNHATVHQFYKDVFGWTSESMPTGTEFGDYHMLAVNGSAHCGHVDMTAFDMDSMPPCWTIYFSVDDVDASAAKAKELGGSVVMEPMDIPNVGRFCGAVDPKGGFFYMFKGANDEPAAQAYDWVELETLDASGSKAFYTGLFGWSASEMPFEHFTYTMFNVGDHPFGGMMDHSGQPDEAPPQCWMVYFHSDDVDATTEKVRFCGGNVTMEPFSMPGVGRMSLCSDPDGAMFFIFKGEPQE